MKRLLMFAACAGAVFVARRRIAERLGPAARKGCTRMCDRMLAGMPESFPPKRIMADLAAVKEQTARILDMLEKA